jgi:hypothetical protein
MQWWEWALVAITVWFGLSVLLAPFIGAALRRRDHDYWRVPEDWRP